MSIAHKIIDALNQKPPYSVLCAGDSDACDTEGRLKMMAQMTDALKHAEVFVFERLPLEKALTVDGAYNVPDLTDAESEFWHDGLLPLPAEVCLYEFQLGPYKSALLILGPPSDTKDADDQNIFVTRLDLMGNELGADMVWMFCRRADFPTKSGDRLLLKFTGPKDLMPTLRTQDREFLERQYGANYFLMVYLTLMLNSKSTEIRTELPPEKLNRARMKRGVQPLMSHRVVTVVPSRFTESVPSQGGTHASPRLHWRRSHLRQYKAPSGEVYHRVVIPRCLVGRAELGEISHEYKVT